MQIIPNTLTALVVVLIFNFPIVSWAQTSLKASECTTNYENDDCFESGEVYSEVAQDRILLKFSRDIFPRESHHCWHIHHGGYSCTEAVRNGTYCRMSCTCTYWPKRKIDNSQAVDSYADPVM